MQRVLEEVRAGAAAVPVVHSEEDALWPVLDVILELGLADVQDNRNAVLVVVPTRPVSRSILPDNALVGVCSVGDHDPVGLGRGFRRLLVGQLDLFYAHLLAEQELLDSLVVRVALRRDPARAEAAR